MDKSKPKFSLGVVEKAEKNSNNNNQKSSNTDALKSSLVSPMLRKPVSSNVAKQIDQVLDRMNKAADSIEQTRQALNIDLFLQQQKEKRLKYARELDSEYQKQKKVREQKLYKKKESIGTGAAARTGSKQSELDKNSQAVQLTKTQAGRYLSELPTISKKPGQVRDNPFEIQSHTLPSIREYLITFDSAALQSWQQEQSLRQIKDDLGKTQLDNGSQPLLYERMEKIADDANRAVFADEDKNTGQIVMKHDIVVQDENSENLVNVLVLILSNKEVFRRVVVNNNDLIGVEGLEQVLTKKKGAGIFLVRLFREKHRCTMVTNGMIPVMKLEFNVIPKYSYCSSGNRFWLPIMEKAYKMFRDIGQKRLGTLGLGEICNDFLDLDPEVIKFNEDALLPENLFKILSFLTANKSLVAFMRKGQISSKSTGFCCSSYENRVYPIKSIKMHSEILECFVEIVNPWKYKVLKKDGSTLLNLKDIVSHFNRLVVVKDYPKEWSGFSFNSHFFSFGPPSASSTEWTKNNQHLMVVTKSVYCRVILKRCLSESSLSKQATPFNDTFGFLMFRVEPDEVKITSMNLQRLIMNHKSTDPSGASGSIFLQKATYILVPYTSNRGLDSYCFLRFEIYFNKDQAITLGNSKYTDVRYKNISNDPEKIIAELQEIEKFERPKTSQILESKEKRLLVPDCESGKSLMTSGIYLQNDSVKLEQIFYPGFLKPLIVKDSVIVAELPSKPQQKKDKNRTSNKEQQDKPATKNDQLLYNEQNQIFKVIIGTDAFTEQVDRSAMEEAMSQLDQRIDLAHYGLTDQAFQSLVQILTEQPRILELDLSDNELTDKSIVQLCYYLEKSNHAELKYLVLDNNLIGEVGARALKGLSQRFKGLEKIYLSNNKDIPSKMLTMDSQKKTLLKH